MAVIGEILDIAKILSSLAGNFKKQKKERKKDIANYYRSIADTLKHTAIMLRQDETPHGDCEKIITYAQQLPQTIGDVIGSDLANELSQRLSENYNVEYLVFTLKDSADVDAELAKLDEAAGYFDASADSLLASK